MKKNLKLAGIDPRTFPKNKQWQVDQDYTDQLSETDKEWLAQFNKELYNGGPKKNDPKAIHNTDALRKDCYNRNNASNRDTYAIHECSGKLWDDRPNEDEDGSFLDTLASNDTNEDLMIYQLDAARKTKKK